MEIGVNHSQGAANMEKHTASFGGTGYKVCLRI